MGPLGGADLRFCSPQPDTSVDGASASHCIPVYFPAKTDIHLPTRKDGRLCRPSWLVPFVVELELPSQNRYSFTNQEGWKAVST